MNCALWTILLMQYLSGCKQVLSLYLNSYNSSMILVHLQLRFGFHWIKCLRSTGCVRKI